MFGLSRLLDLAGSITWRPNGKSTVAHRTHRQPIRRTRLSIDELEDRVVPTLLGQQLFPADYPWNQNISNAPVVSNSAAIIANIGNSIGLHPDWGESSPSNGNDPLYGIPVNIVHGNAPGTTWVNVVIDDYPDESDIVPVPMPSNVVIEGDYQNGPNPNGPGYGTNRRGDSHLIIWDEDNNIAYELFGAARPTDPITMAGGPTNGVWHAAQQSVWNMNSNSFRTLGDTSADAAGLSILAGLARPDEGTPVAQGGQGAINHALRFTLPSSKILPQYIYPASHVVNTSAGANKLPFGARLRLMNTPSVNAIISTLGPQAQIVAHAMQQYGLVLADIGSSMYITGSSATVNTNNVTSFTWNMDDILGLDALTAGHFQVVDLTPQVTSLSISSAAAGSTITVIGQNFSGAAGRLSVFFGNTAATSVTYIDDSHLSVVVPSGTGNVNVKVQSGILATDPTNPARNVTNPIFGYGTSNNTITFQYSTSTQTVSGTNSSLSFGAGTIASGNATTLTILVRDTSNAAVVGLPSNAFSFSLAGGTSAGTFGSVSTTATPGTYTVSFTGTTAGTASGLTAIVNGVTLTAHPTITVNAGAVSASTSTVAFASSIVTSGGAVVVTLVAKDAAGNAITGLASNAFTFALSGGTSAGTFGAVAATATPGTYTATFTSTTSGTASTLTATINGVSLNTRPTITVNPPATTLPFTDTFSGPGSQLSAFWTNQSGNLAIANGVATGQSALNLATLNGINQTNTSVQASVNIPAGQYAGLVSRVQGSGVQSMYFAAIVSSGPGYVAAIWICQGGVFTLLSAANPVAGNGQGTLLLKTLGTSIQLYWQPNGTTGYSQVAAATNSTLTSGSVGVLVSAGTSLDNFNAAAISVVPPQNATLPFAENFAAGNYPGNLGSQLSSFWTNQTGNLSIVNGNAAGQTALNLATLNGITQANTSAQAVVSIPTGQYAGLVSRVQGSGLQNLYFAAIVSSGTGYVAAIWVCQGGVFTLLSIVNPVVGNGQGTMLLKTVGTSIQLFWQPNGTTGFSQVAAVTNATLTTGSVGVLVSAGTGVSSFNAAVANVVAPQNATLPFAENFAAGNYPANLGSQLSNFWTNQSGNLSIVNGNAVGQTTLNLATLNGITQANTAVQSVVNIPAGQYAGLVSRVQGNGVQSMYFAAIVSSGAGYVAAVWICQGGAFTLLTSVNPIVGNGQGTMLLKTVGTSIQLYWQPNGTNGFSQVAVATNATLTTGSVGVLVSAGTAISSFNAAVANVVAPQNATLPFMENFSAVNYPAGVGSQLSSYWQNQLGNTSIINGKATGQTSLNVAALNGVNVANTTVQAAINVPIGQYFGLVSRYGGVGDQNMYFAGIVSTGTGYAAAIWVNQAGVWTQLTALVSIAGSGQGTLRFTTIGSSLQLFWNGALIVGATDSRLTAGTIGVRIGAGASMADFTVS